MPRFEDLHLLPENPPKVDLNNLPEQRAGEYYLPQPGDYVWTLPPDTSAVFKTIATPDGQRVEAVFFGNTALVNEYRQRLHANINNRGFGKDGVNDFAYLLAALGFAGALEDNGQYVNALAGSGGQKFRAELTWTGKSRATGKQFRLRAFTIKKGPKAGTEYHAIPKINGKYQDEFEDEGDNIRCFPQLRNFRPV